MAILLTSVAEAWRKKHTFKDTTSELTDSTDQITTRHDEPTNASNNTITNTNIESSGAANNGHQNDPQQQHPQMIRIGAWPLGTSTGLSPENIEMMEPRAIVRTGTNISREEREVETSQRDHLANNSASVPNSQEVQRLEWFMFLVVLLVLLICEVILYVLVAEGIASVIIVFLHHAIIGALGAIGLYTTIYIGIFVVLTEYHSAIGTFLDRYLYFRRRYQPFCLRVFAYLYPLCVVVRIAYLLRGFQTPYVWFV